MKTLIMASLMCMFTYSQAYGSHYLLEDVSFISDEERGALEKAGVEATEELLERAKDKKGRQGLAKATGLAADRIMALGKLTDLLQVRGVGPKMALLFTAAKCSTARELASQKLETFYEDLKKTNKVKQISEVLPPPELVASWIKAAANVPVKFAN